MRSFNSNFNTEKNKRGTTPINLLKFNFATPVYLSDRDITPSGGSAHKGLIKEWGFLDTAVSHTPGSGVLGSIEIADLQLTIINTESPRFSDNFTSEEPPENITVELYQWFEGLSYSEKEIIFKGVIRQVKYNQYTCAVIIKSIFEKYNKKIGEDLIITNINFPNADPDDIGKMGNIIYGSLSDVPCHAIVSGAVDNLLADITSSQTTIELSDASEFPIDGAVIGVDMEKIQYTGKSGNVLTGCTRGYDGTDAQAHTERRVVWEEPSQFIYQIAGHPVKEIGDIFCKVKHESKRGFKITSIVTKYTGQSGNELSGYEGLAVFTVPSRLTKQQAIDLLVDDGLTIDDATDVVDTIDVDDGITVNDGISVVDGITVSDTIAVSDTIDVDDGIGVSDTIAITVPGAKRSIYPNSGDANVRDGNDQSKKTISAGGTETVGFPSTSYGTIATQYVHFKAWVHAGGTLNLSGWSPSSIPENSNGEFRIQKSGGNWGDSVSFHATGAQVDLYEVWRKEVEYTSNTTKTGSASKTGTATKIGSASKTGSASKSGSASKDGTVTKEGAATKSGTVTRTGEITLSGNSVADVTVGVDVVCEVDGYQDDASGTYTGTANALIERPDHVFKHLWSEIIGAPSSDLDSDAFNDAGGFYAANNYAFSLLINEPVMADQLLMRLALQCRSRFFVTPYGKAKLIVRRLNQASGHAIPKAEIKRDSISVQRSARIDLINQFNIYYNKDHSKEGNNPETYKSVKAFSDGTSITRYGTRTYNGGADLFCFAAVSLDAMAQCVGSFLRDYHSTVRRIVRFGVFLDNMEIEPGDIIDVTHDLDAMTGFVCEVQKILHHLGSGKKNVIDHLEIIAVEN